MQSDLARLSCPLCKRQLPAESSEHTPSTRLCESCQTTVLTAFRGPTSVAARSAAVYTLASNIPAQVQSNAPVFEHSFVGAPALLEVTAEDAMPFANELSPPIPFDATDRFDFYKDEDPVDRIPSVRSESPAFSENGGRQREKLFEGFVHSVAVAEHEHARVDDAQLVVQPANIAESAIGSEYAGHDGVEYRTEPRSIPEAAVADPWEAPLAAWEYSHNEWPVLVGPARLGSLRKVRWAIAAVVVVASAAGFYFLVYRPANPQRAAAITGTTTKVSASERPAGSGSAEPASLPATQAKPDEAAATSQPAEAASRETESIGSDAAQGSFSLQAAAFPTQDGADEFAEKLKRAGVPSYVVPADLARRGRWFRVRVGRFNTAENAQRFAGEAQQRARAAGLAVQLIVCQ